MGRSCWASCAAPTAATGVETGVGVGTGVNTAVTGDTAAGITTNQYLGGSTNVPNPFYKAVTPEPTGFLGGVGNFYKSLDPAEKIGLGVGAATLSS